MGDGGWNSFNQQIVGELEKQGFGVIAFNSRKYFWNEKSPEAFAHDIERVSDYFMKAWNKQSLNIVGYSFGADVASFLPDRVSAGLRKKINKVALISPSASTDYEIRLSDMVGTGDKLNRKYPVEPEIEHAGLPIVCTFGTEEDKVLKSSLKSTKSLTVIKLPGDHRYQYNFALLVKSIGM